MNTPFPDQQIVIDLLRDAYRQGSMAPLLVAPCGFGKTFVFSYVTAGAVRRDSRVLLLVHRDELVDQISDALNDQGVRHGVIAGGWRYERGRSAYVASVLTMAKRLDHFSPDLIVVDEAHHCTPRTTWGRVLAAYPQARRLGVTATPCRLSGEGLGNCFDRMILGPTTEQLMRSGRLARPRVFAPPIVNRDKIRKRMREFIQGDLIDAVDRPTITGKALAHYCEIAPNTRAVAFCISVEHAKNVAEEFRKAGYTAESIDGRLPRDVRRAIVASFRAGYTKVLTSCSLVDEGFDCPDMETAIDLCPTESLGRFWQRIGRLFRRSARAPRKTLIDASGNSLRHGLLEVVDGELAFRTPEWSLHGATKDSSSANRSLSTRICPNCFSAQPSRLPACRNCKKDFPVDSRTVAQKQGKLEELTPDQIEAARLTQQLRETKTLFSLIALGRARGYANPEGWAKHVLDARQLKKKRA
jgi:DNA repair protein RadD